MVRIQFTNVVVDDFTHARNNPHDRYVHILTHFHTDHLKGLSKDWNFGLIYCSETTRKLLLTRFPSLSCLHALALNEQHNIKLSSTLDITVTFFDANHCAGAVMVLLEGYMGRVLHTGDFRFDRDIFETYTHLYPTCKANPSFTSCSLPIDVLHFDNTFLSPRFRFASKSKVMTALVEFVQRVLKGQEEREAGQTEPYDRIYIGIDSFGKEEVLVQLALRFQTLIVVDAIRYEQLQAMDVDLELFTTNREEGVIQVVSKRLMGQYLEEQSNAVGVILTGWVNAEKYRMPRYYAIPYSLHSNYDELNSFLSSVRPSLLYPIVHTDTRNYSDLGLSQQEARECHLGQEVKLMEKYCSPLSPAYKQLLGDADLQKKIHDRLEIAKTLPPPAILPMASSGLPAVSRKRYRIDSHRNEEEISQLTHKFRQLQQNVSKEPRNGRSKAVDCTPKKKPLQSLIQQDVIQIGSDSEDEGNDKGKGGQGGQKVHAYSRQSIVQVPHDPAQEAFLPREICLEGQRFTRREIVMTRPITARTSQCGAKTEPLLGLSEKSIIGFFYRQK